MIMHYNSILPSQTPTNTNICPGQHIRTVPLHPGVPSQEIGKGDLLVADDLASDNSRIHVTKPLAIRQHAWLSGLWPLNAIPCSRGWCWS
jgi:hypothetical protein